jgi:hypothetical protein
VKLRTGMVIQWNEKTPGGNVGMNNLQIKKSNSEDTLTMSDGTTTVRLCDQVSCFK